MMKIISQKFTYQHFISLFLFFPLAIPSHTRAVLPTTAYYQVPTFQFFKNGSKHILKMQIRFYIASYIYLLSLLPIVLLYWQWCIKSNHNIPLLVFFKNNQCLKIVQLDECQSFLDCIVELLVEFSNIHVHFDHIIKRKFKNSNLFDIQTMKTPLIAVHTRSQPLTG